MTRGVSTMYIQGSLILITSAGTLLGSMLAERLAELGATIVLNDNDYNGLLQTYERCRTISDHVDYYHVKDYSHQSIEGVFQFIHNTYHQSPDILINNWPNLSIPSVADKNPIELFTHNIATMASTLFSFVQICAEHMRKEKRQGVVVNIISKTNVHTANGYAHAASLMSGFTQNWAKELTPFKIRVGGILPSTAEQENEPLNELIDEVLRNTEYIVENEYFSGRVMSA